MKISLTNVCLAVTLSLIVGCSSTPSTDSNTSSKPITNKPVSENDKDKISVIKLISQKNLIPEPDSAGVTGGAVGGLVGGLIGAAISASIQKERRKAMQPIMDTLTGYNIQNEFNKKLSRLSGPNFAKKITVKNYSRLTNVKAKELGVIANYYLMANHLELSVNAMTEVQFADNEDEYGDPSSKQDSYSKNYSIKTKIPKNSKKEATEYLANNPAVLKKMINASLDKIVADISKRINKIKRK